LYKQAVVVPCLIVKGYVVESARLWVCFLSIKQQSTGPTPVVGHSQQHIIIWQVVLRFHIFLRPF